MAVGNYRLSIRRSGRVVTYLYPDGEDLTCMRDAVVALLQGRCVLIEPPGADALESKIELPSR